MSQQLHRIFSPASVVVVGASSDPSKRGNHVLRALRDSGYGGAVHAVNPKGGSAYGIDFLTSTQQIPLGTDLALLALPARLVPDALRELGERGLAGAVVLANGFAESGPEGARLQQELQRAVLDSGVRVIGPNTSGVLNVPLGLNLVGLPDVVPGPVTVLTQSGNMLLSLVQDDRATRGPGFASYVGLGNQADVAYHECLQHFATDKETGAIAVHSEGLPDGRAFLVAAAEAARTCPVVMLRGGRSAVGQQTALSHTGSVAGSDRVASAVLKQAGVELVERSDELSVVSGVMATVPALRAGTGVAILADGGGHATLAADALTAQHVPLASLSTQTQRNLLALLGPTAAVHNPVDVAGATDSDPSLFADAVQALMEDPAVGLVLVIGLYGGYHVRFDPRLRDIEDRTADRLLDLKAQHGTALLVQSCYAGLELDNHDVLREGGVPVLASIDHAVRCIAALTRRGLRLATARDRSTLTLPAPEAQPSPHPSSPVSRDASEPGHRCVMPEPQARRLVQDAGLTLGPWALARTPEELERCLTQLALPCAVKVVSEQVVHKSDAGGVSLSVTAGQGHATWARIRDAVTRHVPEATIDAMIVTPMVGHGVELLIGATRDAHFGPIVAFGTGGVLVEAIQDVSFRAAPLTHLEARELIADTTAARLLDGYRDFAPVDVDALAELLVAVGDLMVRHPEVIELDLNPVIADGSSLHPVDVRIVTTTAARTAGKQPARTFA